MSTTLTDAGVDANDDAIPSGFAELLTAPDTIKPRPTALRRPVTLQKRLVTGVFMAVCDFDAHDELSEHYVRTAVELLSAVDPSLQWRVVSPGAITGSVLLSYTAAEGWQTR